MRESTITCAGVSFQGLPKGFYRVCHATPVFGDSEDSKVAPLDFADVFQQDPMSGAVTPWQGANTSAYQEWDRIIGWFDVAKALAVQSAVKQLAAGTRLVEVGSFQGRSSIAIASVLPPGSQLYCVDHFRGSAEHQSMNIGLGDMLGAFGSNLVRFGVHDRVRTMVMPSLEAAEFFVAESVSLIFVDASHDAASVSADLAAWYPKLKPCGYLFCDDYCPHWPGVVQAIDNCGFVGQLVAPELWLHRKRAVYSD
jgi:hypothetical protein